MELHGHRDFRALLLGAGQPWFADHTTTIGAPSATVSSGRSCLRPSWRSLGRALFSDGFEALANLRDVCAKVVQARKRRERLEAEDALEERGRAVAHRAEVFLAAGFGEQASLDQARDDAVDVHASDPRDLGA